MNEVINNLTDEIMVILNNLHFVRADWFYAFIPLLLYLLFAHNKTQNNRNWTSVIDRQLLPFVLTSDDHKQARYPLLLVFIAASLCITALAGPVYKKLPQPVYREQSSLVVLLDLSQSMNAADIKPSRLSRAKLELLDILKTRKTGQTALIVYAADAFVVTPLTDDNATIANLVPALETDMMPAQGSNLSVALAKTASLFNQAGIIRGDILVITDDIPKRHRDAIKKISSQGFRLSIFGIGTTEGAPVPLESGFLQDSDGAIVIPKLQAEKLQQYALIASGLYTGLQADDSDTDKLTQIFQSSEITQDDVTKDLDADIWQEEGHWLLLPLLFFAALWARRGWLAIALIFILPLPQPVYAADGERTFLDTEHLWSSPDQKAMKAFNAGDNETAADQFTQPDWKASAYFRNGNYQAAADVLKETAHSDGHYNRANALARLGNYEEAIKAYDRAIELDENNEDAKYNREQVKKALQQQNSEQQDSQQNESDENKSEQEKSDQQKDSEEKDSQQQDDKDNQQQDKQSEQQSEDSKPGENQQQEEQELKQRDAENEKQQQQDEQEQYDKSQQEQKKQDDAEQDSNEQENIENKESDEKPEEIEINPMEASITEEEKATEQWLKRIPDDPGGLLRRKFLYQYNQTNNQDDDDKPW